MAFDPTTRPAEFALRRARETWWRAGLSILLFLCAAAALTLALLDRDLLAGPGLLAVAGIAAVLFLLKRDADLRLTESENHQKGAAAERTVGTDLDELIPCGCSVFHDVPAGSGGNIDHVVVGPARSAFLIETKYRRYEQRDLLRARREAAHVARMLGVAWVTPVICVATRSYGPIRHEGVWILGRKQLPPWLRTQLRL